MPKQTKAQRAKLRSMAAKKGWAKRRGNRADYVADMIARARRDVEQQVNRMREAERRREAEGISWRGDWQPEPKPSIWPRIKAWVRRMVGLS